jgi:hypothetical protein
MFELIDRKSGGTRCLCRSSTCLLGREEEDQQWQQSGGWFYIAGSNFPLVTVCVSYTISGRPTNTLASHPDDSWLVNIGHALGTTHVLPVCVWGGGSQNKTETNNIYNDER